MDWDKVVMWCAGGFLMLLGAFLVFALIWGLVALPVAVSAQKWCAEAGYADHEVVWFLDVYCVTWVDANKIIVPLEEAVR